MPAVKSIFNNVSVNHLGYNCIKIFICGGILSDIGSEI